jgi:hypothetical protein
MADNSPSSEHYEALRRDERTVTSLVIDTEQRVVTVTLGGAIAGTNRRTFAAAISEHPGLVHVTLGDEICAPMVPEAADSHGPNRNGQSGAAIHALPSCCPMGRCGLYMSPAADYANADHYL